jgi:hypothetical protein
MVLIVADGMALPVGRYDFAAMDFGRRRCPKVAAKDALVPHFARHNRLLTKVN